MNDLPVKKLTSLTKHFGLDLLNDFARCDELLADFCSDFRLEANLLFFALREGCAKKLLETSSNGAVPSIVNTELIRLLQNDTGITETNAAWAIQGISAVLELTIDTQKVVEPSVTPSYQSAASKTVNCNDYSPKHLPAGLMWASNGDIAGRTMTHYEADEWVKQLVYDGYRDWRLPTKEELESFVLLGKADSSKKPGKIELSDWFNTNGFNNIQSNWYWTSSSNPGTTGAFYVGMSSGYACSITKSAKGNVWPVRSIR